MRWPPLLILLLPTIIAAQAPGRIVSQTWESVTLDGSPAGVVSSTVREVGAGDTVQRVHTQDLKLSLRRGSAKVELRQEHGFEENASGKVVGLFLRQYQGSKLFLELTGQVVPGQSDRLEVTRDGRTTRLAWSEETFRPGQLDRPPGKERWQTGDTGTVRLYEPTYNRVVAYEATALAKENLVLEGRPISVTPLKLVPEVLVAGSRRVTLPTVCWWLDDSGRVVRRELDMPGLGMLTLTRTDRADGKAPVVTAPVVDVLERGLVPLDRTVTRPYTTIAARLRLTLKDVSEAGQALPSDGHQTVREVRPGVLDVVIHPVGDQGRGEPMPGKEYLGSSQMLDWEDRAVRELASATAPAERRDLWTRARARATWVRRNLRVDNSAALAPVSQIVRNLHGDCRHAALLTTALCRADGLPARTAIGLVYIERNRKPYLGFHMWTEVFVEGAWRGLDGTPGLGGVGALHLKVTDASWDRETTLAPLQPALKLVGKLNAEIVEIVE